MAKEAGRSEKVNVVYKDTFGSQLFTRQNARSKVVEGEGVYVYHETGVTFFPMAQVILAEQVAR